MNTQQLTTIKSLTPFTNIKFHGNRKTYKGLSVTTIREIVGKKLHRELSKLPTMNGTPTQVTRNCIEESKRTKGTPYFKVMIEGSTGIYYASSVYGHKDYNKTRLFDKNEKTLQLMTIFNKAIA